MIKTLENILMGAAFTVALSAATAVYAQAPQQQVVFDSNGKITYITNMNLSGGVTGQIYSDSNGNTGSQIILSNSWYNGYPNIAPPATITDLITDIVKKDPKSKDLPELYATQGRIFDYNQEYIKGLNSYKRAIEKAEKIKDYDKKKLASLYHSMARGPPYMTVEEQMASHIKAVELDPNNAGYHNSLGVKYSLRGDYHKAIKELSIAIQLDPANELYKSNLISIETESKK